MKWFFYIKEPKNSTRILLDHINAFSQVAGYKINTQYLVAFLHTNNKYAKKQFMEIIPFTITSKTK